MRPSSDTQEHTRVAQSESSLAFQKVSIWAEGTPNLKHSTKVRASNCQIPDIFIIFYLMESSWDNVTKYTLSETHTELSQEPSIDEIPSALPLPPPLLLPPPVFKEDPYLKELMAKHRSHFKNKTEQMLEKHPPIQIINPSVVANKIYPEEELEPEDKSLFSLCQTCNNWLKHSQLEFHQKAHASHIGDGLYLGSSVNSSNIKELRRLKIRSILNCTVEIPNTFPEDASFSYKKLTLTDNVGQSIRPYFDECIQFIGQSLKSGQNVLVHCAMGKSRSATIVIMYLMIAKKLTLRAAYEHVKSKRPIITPNPSYVRELLEIEREMFGSNSIEASQIKPAYKHTLKNW